MGCSYPEGHVGECPNCTGYWAPEAVATRAMQADASRFTALYASTLQPTVRIRWAEPLLSSFVGWAMRWGYLRRLCFKILAGT